MENKNLITTAYHEAGHAALQLVFEMTPSRVTIVPDEQEETAGAAHHLDGDNMTPEGCGQLAMVCYAGAETQRILHGDIRGDLDDYIYLDDSNVEKIQIREGIRLGARSDDEEAETYLPVAGKTESELRTETAAKVREHWPLVERVAKELMEHRTLTMEELDTLFYIYKGEATEDDLIAFRQTREFFNQ